MTAQEMVEAIMRECRKAPTQTPHPRFSSALSCLRAHVYDVRLVDAGQWPDVVDRPARWNFAAMVGISVGDLIETAARRLGATTQQPADLGGIKGNLDIEWGDYVLDLKWCGDYKWKQIKKAAIDKEVAQVNAYAVARGKPLWALIYLPTFMLGKGEALEYIIHEGKADKEKAHRDVTERWALVEEHRAAGTLPEREVEETVCRRLRCMHLRECRGDGT